MVDVSGKSPSVRRAEARGCMVMNDAAMNAARSGDSKKGDVLAVARIAAIQATKLTDRLIPLCHSIPIEAVDVQFEWIEGGQTTSSDATLECRVLVQTTAKTGVEMEAMTGVSVACLTVYDMLKSVDRGMDIQGIHLVRKSGGKSGEYLRPT